MNNILFKYLILIVSLLPGSLILLSQETNVADSSYEILEELDKMYGADQRLVKGKLYHAERYVAGNPFCINEEWQKGQVVMDGIVFENLLLKYDIASNKLVLNTSGQSNTSWQVSLNTGNISSFKLDNKQFIVFPGDGNKNKPIFCEQVCSGPVDFLLLRTKEIRIASSGEYDYKYEEKYSNYLYKDGRLMKYGGSRSLFKLFPDYKNELKKYISQQKLVLRRKNTNDRALLVDYCNKLLREQR
jgi:hypothetical protein